MSRFWFWLTHNAVSGPQRLAARYLRRHGWVAFYYPPALRRHACQRGGFCLMVLAEHERRE